MPGLGGALDQARAQVDKTRASLEHLAQTKFDALQASLDPVVAAQQRLAQGRDTVSHAQSLGIITDAQAAETLAQLETQYAKTAASSGIFAGATGLVTEGLTALVGTLSVGAFVEFGKGVLESSASLVGQARQARVSVEELQAYQLVMKESGADADDFTRLVEKATAALGQAKENNEAVRLAFHEIGLDWQSLVNLPVPQYIQTVAQALLRQKDANIQANAEQAIFGKGAGQLTSVLEQLAQNIDDIAAQKKAQGEIFDDEQANKATEALNKLDESWLKLKVAASTPVNFVVGGLADVLDFFTAPTTAAQARNSMDMLVIAAQRLADAKKQLEVDKWNVADVATLKADEREITALTTVYDNLKKARDHANAAGTTGAPASPGEASNLQSELDRQQAMADAAKSNETQLVYNNLLDAAKAKLKDDYTLVNQHRITLADIGSKQQQLVAYLDKEVSGHKQNNAEIAIAAGKQQAANELAKQHNDLLQKHNADFDIYLGKLSQEADAASKSVAEREIEADVIKAAQALESELTGKVKTRVQTYQEALGVLNDHLDATKKLGAQEVIDAANKKLANDIEGTTIAQLDREVSVLGVGKDLREQALELANLEAEKGKGALDTANAQGVTLRQQIIDRQRLLDLQGGQDDIDKLKEENDLASLQGDEQQRVSAVLQQIHERHGNITDDQRAEIEQQVALGQEIARQKQMLSEFDSTLKDQIKDALTGQNFSLKGIGKAFGDDIANEIATSVTKGLEQVVTGPAVQQLHSFTDQIEQFLGVDTGESAAAKAILDEATARDNVALAIAGQISAENTETAALTANTAARQAANSALAQQLGLTQQIAATGAAAGASGAPIQSSSPLPQMQIPQFQIAGGGSLLDDIFGVDFSKDLGSEIGAALQGMGVGSLLGGLTGSRAGGEIGGALGGAAGEAIGGPMGAEIGQIAGSLLGGFIGGLTGSDNHAAWGNFGAGEVYRGTTGGNSTTSQQAGQVAQQISDTFALLQSDGVQFNDWITEFSIAQKKHSTYELSSGQTVQLDTTGNVNDLVLQALKALIQTATISDPNLQQVLTTNKFQSASDLTDAINFVTQTYDVIAAGKPAMNSVEQQMHDLNQAFDAAAAEAKKLGLSVVALTEGEAASFNATVQEQIEAIENPLQAALDDEARNAQARLDTAQTYGADIVAVEQLNADERAQIIQQFADQAKQSLQGLQSLVADLTYGSDSALAPDQKYDNALAAYQSAKSAVMANQSQDNIDAYEQAAQALASVAHDFFGSSTQYGSIIADIVNVAQLLDSMEGISLPPIEGLGGSTLGGTSGSGGTGGGSSLFLGSIAAPGMDWSPVTNGLSSLGDRVTGSIQAADSDIVNAIMSGFSRMDARFDALIAQVAVLADAMSRANLLSEAIIRRTTT